MKPLSLPAKIAVVCLGLFAAFAIAWLAVDLRQRATQGPDAQASAGMYAFGDLIVGVGVFGLVALVPLGLALYWLRSAEKFWTAVAGGALLFAATGLVALGLVLANRGSTGIGMLLAVARIGLMPLTALALLVGAIAAPQRRQRGMLLVAALTDGLVISGVIATLWLRRF